MGTGDFTHPEWFRMMREELVQNQQGLYEVRGVRTFRPVALIPTSEIACIYKRGGQVRRLHVIIIMPTLESVDKLNSRLSIIGNLKADGRPILGLDAEELLKIVLDVDERGMLIPAHAWTPWFAVFGSKSGFDSLEEAFGDMAKYVTAIETGLSSDPAMNWRLSKLDNIVLTSNSDAHSLENLGREANVMIRGDGMTYDRLRSILQGKLPKDFLYTIEFFPEEGKYHCDGHAPCKVRLTSEETKRLGGVCPKCKKQITIGVLSRVEELADRKASEVPKNKISFKSIVPLREVIGDVLGVGRASKRVVAMYARLVPVVGTEFEVLLHASLESIAKNSTMDIAAAIERMRRGDVHVEPGYDGIYGVVSVAGETDKKMQATLF